MCKWSIVILFAPRHQLRGELDVVRVGAIAHLLPRLFWHS
jgi:hypothetical protein